MRLSPADADQTLTLPVLNGPFDFQLTLRYLQRRPGELVDRVEAGRYRRLLVLNEGPVLVQVEALPAGSAAAAGASRLSVQEAPALAVSLPGGDPALLPVASTVMASMFGLADDLDSFRAAMRVDTVLSETIKRLNGLRLVRTAAPFEALIWAITGQQITLTFAFRLKAALVRRYGIESKLDGETYWAFPPAERLAGADAAAIAAGGFGRRKAETIITCARAVANGELEINLLGRLDRAEAMERLTALPGVGPWTAAYTLLRGFGDAGSCPISDLGLRAAVGQLYGQGGKAPLRQVAGLVQQWGPWCGYATFYLWNSPENRRSPATSLS